LLGSAQALRAKRIKTPFGARDRESTKRSARAIEERLGPAAFDAADECGGVLDTEAAVHGVQRDAGRVGGWSGLDRLL
jgi:hypothetical protein